MPATIVIGHRGAPRAAPENTLKSFYIAAEQGARMSAMDNATRNAGDMIKKQT